MTFGSPPDKARRGWKKKHALRYAHYRGKGYAVADATQAATGDEDVIEAQEQAEHAEALAQYATAQLQDLRGDIIAVQTIASMLRALIENGV